MDFLPMSNNVDNSNYIWDCHYNKSVGPTNYNLPTTLCITCMHSNMPIDNNLAIANRSCISCAHNTHTPQVTLKSRLS